MAQGTIAYSSGTIAAAGSGNVTAFIRQIRTQLKAYAGSAWVDGDVLIDTVGSVDYEMHSVGDPALGSGGNAGDTELWFRIKQTSTVNVTLYGYQDWSSTSHTGNRVYNGTAVSLSDTQQIDWWCVCNEYKCIFFAIQGSTWYATIFGQLDRTFPTRLNGIARLSQATAGTGAITLNVDRDISANLQVGQKIWLINHTPDGQSLVSDYTEMVTVTSVGATTIGVSGVTNTPYQIGSLVGLDPCPAYLRQGTSLSASNALYFVSHRDGTYTSAGGQTAQFDTPVTLTLANEKPDVDGLYAGYTPGVRMTASGAGFAAGYRGMFGGHLVFFACGTQVDLDLHRLDFDDTQKYKVFYTLGGGSGNWLPAIGPGAS
jgi:hypothetical protein